MTRRCPAERMTVGQGSRRIRVVPERSRGAGLAAATGASSVAGADSAQDVILELVPVIRRVVAARVRDFQLVDDLVQETLARVMAARDRIEQDTLAPYAVAVARNLVACGAGPRTGQAHRSPVGRSHSESAC